MAMIKEINLSVYDVLPFDRHPIQGVFHLVSSAQPDRDKVLTEDESRSVTNKQLSPCLGKFAANDKTQCLAVRELIQLTPGTNSKLVCLS